MVFYFSATGNSLWVAQYISNAFNEPLCEVSRLIRKHSAEGLRYTLRDEAEMLFFVFPVHSWGTFLGAGIGHAAFYQGVTVVRIERKVY